MPPQEAHRTWLLPADINGCKWKRGGGIPFSIIPLLIWRENIVDQLYIVYTGRSCIIPQYLGTQYSAMNPYCSAGTSAFDKIKSNIKNGNPNGKLKSVECWVLEWSQSSFPLPLRIVLKQKIVERPKPTTLFFFLHRFNNSNAPLSVQYLALRHKPAWYMRLPVAEARNMTLKSPLKTEPHWRRNIKTPFAPRITQ